MRVIVAGGGAIGVQLGELLVAARNEVVIVERDRSRASSLSKQAATVVNGDACRADVLEAAGGLHTDVLVACTGSDEENLVISVLAKRHLEIPRVVARVNVDANRWLFDDSWGVDAAISSVSRLVGLIEEATGSAESLTLADLSAAGLTVVEINVSTESVAIGKTAADLAIGKADVIAAVIRAGKALPVDRTVTFDEGDSVLVITQPGGERRLRAAFYTDSPAR